MEDGEPTPESEKFKNFTESAHESSWGSLHDSELNIALRQQFSKNNSKKDTSNIEIATDVDTDEDILHYSNNNGRNAVATDIKPPTLPNYAKESVSDDWGSMNDSQFISFVNKISQTQRDSKSTASVKKTLLSSDKANNTAESSVFLDEDFQISSTPKCKVSNISSSPILLAQKLPQLREKGTEVEYQEDVMTKQDYEDSNRYAFEDHEGYFKVKNTKQRKQDQEYSEFLKGKKEDGQTFPPLFSNCAIHINGRTDPDILQLRKMILLHGGTNVPYLSSKGIATHIVAESLPPRKRIQFSNCKVVSPKWIVESIAAKKLLNWAQYRLEQLGEYGQQEINFLKVNTLMENNDVSEVQTGNIADHGTDMEVNDSLSEDKRAEKEDILSQELSRAGVDARDSNFLRIFFSKSRLHHLSTWKADLRSEFLNKAAALLKERQFDAPKNNIVPENRVILHVDFDCFFARVSANLHQPMIDFDNTPCCVTHGGASADVSSCNYVARQFGVKNGMWFSKAQKLCPNIVCLPYQFDDYERVSNIFYAKLLALNIDSILPVSVDEALVDISSLCMESGGDTMGVLKNIKCELDTATGCTVSCGSGKNVLLAKLALRKAKPNGVYVVPSDENQILRFLDDIDVRKLPGFGDRLFEKLLSLMGKGTNTTVTISSLRCIEKEKLISSFGIKTGEKLYLFSRGVDDTSIDLLSDPEKYLRKSLGIDVNWGIRFSSNAEVEDFLNRLAAELSKRLVDCCMTGSMLTLKLSIRHPDAPIEPPKYLGMGYCTFVSKSSRLGISTRTTGILSSEMKYLWRFLNVDPKELRGVGVSMNKLIPEGNGKIDTNNQMKLQFKPAAATSLHTAIQKELPEEVFEDPPALEPPAGIGHKIQTHQKFSPSKRTRGDDFLSEEIDWEVFDNLPASLQEEIKRELRKRKLQSSPIRKKVASTGKDIAFMLSPSKRTPNNIQQHDIYNLITPEKVNTKDENQIIFQGINVSEEPKILKKLLFWMDFTLEEKTGIEKKDLELFKDFMLKLLSRNDVIRYTRIVSAMSTYLHLKKDMRGYEEWFYQLKQLKALPDEQSFTAFEFRF